MTTTARMQHAAWSTLGAWLLSVLLPGAITNAAAGLVGVALEPILLAAVCAVLRAAAAVLLRQQRPLTRPQPAGVIAVHAHPTAPRATLTPLLGQRTARGTGPHPRVVPSLARRDVAVLGDLEQRRGPAPVPRAAAHR
jgi:hypothetical protein